MLPIVMYPQYSHQQFHRIYDISHLNACWSGQHVFDFVAVLISCPTTWPFFFFASMNTLVHIYKQDADVSYRYIVRLTLLLTDRGWRS